MAGSWEKPSPQKNNFPDRLKFFQHLPMLMKNKVLRQITAGLKKVINCLKIGHIKRFSSLFAQLKYFFTPVTCLELR